MENITFHAVHDIQVCFTGISAGVVIQDSKTVVTSELREVTVYDSNTKTKYPKVSRHYQGSVTWTKGSVFMLITESKQSLSERLKGISL